MKIENQLKSCSLNLILSIGLANAFLISNGCRTSSASSPRKHKEQMRILESRHEVPSPYVLPLDEGTGLHIRNEEPITAEPIPTLEDQFQSIPVEQNAQLEPLTPIQGVIKEPQLAMIVDNPGRKIPEKIEPLPNIPEIKPLIYTVKKGDTLWDIARMYGITTQELATHNNRKMTDILRIGTVLTLPPGAAYNSAGNKKATKKDESNKETLPIKESTSEKKQMTNEKSTTSQSNSAKRDIPANGKYIVQKGDNLWEISRTFGLKIDTIKKINNLSSDKLQPGQLLILIDSSGAGTSTSGNAAVSSTNNMGNTANSNSGNSASSQSTNKGLQTEPVTTINIPDTNANNTAPSTSNKSSTSTTNSVDVNAMEKLPHYVQPGDTLEDIANMYGSTVEWILKMNPDIKGNESLKDGKELKIPYQDKKRN